MSAQDGSAETGSQMFDRLFLAVFGGLGGFVAWALIIRYSGGVETQRLVHFLTVFGYGFFAGGLAMYGHMRWHRALLLSAFVALPAALLMVWAGLRFDQVSDSDRTGYVLFAAFMLLALPLPFLMVRETGKGWRDYTALFLTSWNIVVRFAAAWLFAGAVWLVIMLSDTLLQLVDIMIIDRLIEIESVNATITGAALGLGMAVVDELEEYVSPYLVLRLLRLLLPAVLLVILVFIGAMPFRGLSHLFGDFSAAGTLMGVAIGAVALISISVDADDGEMGGGAFMRAVTQGLVLCLPVLAGLAVYAVWLRVAQYGWTPARVAAATGALVVTGYGVVYAQAVLRRAGWAGRIRQGNIGMAGLLLALAALWLSPVLNAEGISARSQIARFESGAMKVADLPLLEMRWDWGLAGARALDRLGAISGHAEQADLTERLAATTRSTSRWDPTGGVDTAALEREFLELVVLRPEGAVLPDTLGFLAAGLQNTQWVNACRRLDALGRAGCVIVVAELTEANAGPEAILFWREADGTLGSTYLPARDEIRLSLRPFGNMALNPGNADAVFEALHAGDFTVAPPRAKALQIGEMDFLLLP